MTEPAFAEGIEATYKEHQGYIQFVCDDYVTMCIGSNADPMRDVCILIYRSNWKDIKLMKESTK